LFILMLMCHCGLDWIGLDWTAHQQYISHFEPPLEVGKDTVGHWCVSPGSFMCPVIADTQDLGLFCLIRKTGQPEKLISEKSLASESFRTRDYKIGSLTHKTPRPRGLPICATVQSADSNTLHITQFYIDNILGCEYL
jgi:hypothetical protein